MKKVFRRLFIHLGKGQPLPGKAYLLKVKGVDFTQGISNTKSVSITLQMPSGKDIDKFDKDAEFVREVNMKWEAVIHVFLTVRENGLLY